jgi:antitoxin component YwqK of YwqJK toxin-antitoxin module
MLRREIVMTKFYNRNGSIKEIIHHDDRTKGIISRKKDGSLLWKKSFFDDLTSIASMIHYKNGRKNKYEFLYNTTGEIELLVVYKENGRTVKNELWLRDNFLKEFYINRTRTSPNLSFRFSCSGILKEIGFFNRNNVEIKYLSFNEDGERVFV